MGRQTLPDDERPWAKPRGIEAVKLIPGMPVKPRGLSESASRYWDELLVVMNASGISLIPGDASIVAMAATLKADLSAAWEIVKRDGRYVTTKTGVMKIHPAVEDTAKLNEKLSKCLWQLGLTPKSRGNTTAKTTEADEPDELDLILDGCKHGKIKSKCEICSGTGKESA